MKHFILFITTLFLAFSCSAQTVELIASAIDWHETESDFSSAYNNYHKPATHGDTWGEIIRWNNKIIFKNTWDNYTIWITDGTTQGTYQLIDDPDCCSQYGQHYLPNDRLFWVTNSGQQAKELKAYDLVNGGITVISTNAYEIRGVGDAEIIFETEDGQNSSPDNSLWVTDGTANGTSMFYQDYYSDFFIQGDVSSRVAFVQMPNSSAYIGCIGISSNQKQLGTIDPTNPNSFNFIDMTAIDGGTNHGPYQFKVGDDGYMYFMGRPNGFGNGSESRLYKSNGTAQGTSYIGTAIDTDGETIYSVSMILVGDKMLYTKSDAISQSGYMDLNSGQVTMFETDPNIDCDLRRGDILDGSKYIYYRDRDVWLFDANDNSTTLIKDLDPSPIAGHDKFALVNNGKFYFSHPDVSSPAGFSIWESDGTPGGTVPVTDEKYFDWGGSAMFAIGDDIYTFSTADGGQTSLYKIDPDGTSSSTSIDDVDSKSSVSLQPNPTQSTLNLTVGDKPYTGTASVYSADGRLQLQEAVVGNMDVSTLPNGIYILQLMANEEAELQQVRFVKQ